MSSRSRWLRWVQRLPASDPETYSSRLRYLKAESQDRRSRRALVGWGPQAMEDYRAAASVELAAALGGKS